jgi:hypothetical protein
VLDGHCEVFFEELFVPDSAVLGEVDQGFDWRLVGTFTVTIGAHSPDRHDEHGVGTFYLATSEDRCLATNENFSCHGHAGRPI